MPADVTCPSCRQRSRIPAGSPGVTIWCPFCGADIDTSPAPLPAPDDIASWLAPAADPPPTPAIAEDPSCPSCGYTGPMDVEANLRVCPACHAVPPPGGQILSCPGCGLAIGISEPDRDKTIICPRCKAFLGCVSRSEAGRRGHRRKR